MCWCARRVAAGSFGTGALCALALYTHAEVQDAVELFEGLVAHQPDEGVVGAHGYTGPCFALLVPVLQLLVATVTLFVQGIVFLSYRVPIAEGEAKYANGMEAVYACVALAFICDVDNRAWVFVKPLLQAAAPPGNTSQLACCSADSSSSLLLLLARGWSSCCSRAPRVQFTRLQCCRHVACACRCFQRLLACLFTVLFHAMVFVYESTFGMLLILYATDWQLNYCPGQLATMLGCSCFIAFQMTAGVRSRPMTVGSSCNRSSDCSGCRQFPWLRPVVINLLVPLVVGGIARGLYTNFDNAVAQSAWRCNAGAVIGCHTCDTTSEWCTATVACADKCKGGDPGAAVCIDNWCMALNDDDCVSCLLRSNSSVPDVNNSIKINITDDLLGQLCTGIGRPSLSSCMNVWMVFIPLALMLLLAGMFLLLYEAMSRQPVRGQSCTNRPPQQCA